MKKISIKPGVVLVSVCDEHMLITTREARDGAPYVQQINSAGAFYWKLLEEGLEPKEIIRRGAEHYQMPEKKAAAVLLRYVKKLYDAGFITFEDAEDVGNAELISNVENVHKAETAEHIKRTDDDETTGNIK